MYSNYIKIIIKKIQYLNEVFTVDPNTWWSSVHHTRPTAQQDTAGALGCRVDLIGRGTPQAMDLLILGIFANRRMGMGRGVGVGGGGNGEYRKVRLVRSFL